MNRGLYLLPFRNYLENLINGEYEGVSRKDYKELIINSFAQMLERNWIQGHVYKDMIDLDCRNTGYIGKMTVHLDDNKDGLNHKYMSFTFLADCVSFSCGAFGQLYLRY